MSPHGSALHLLLIDYRKPLFHQKSQSLGFNHFVIAMGRRLLLLLPLGIILVRGYPCILYRPSRFLSNNCSHAPSHGLVSLYICGSRWGGMSEKLVVAGWDVPRHVDQRPTEDHVVWGLNVDHEKHSDNIVWIGADQK